MTTTPGRDRSHESVINAALSRLLTERVGLSAAAETLRDGLRPDIVVRLPEGPVILETEVEPARTVEADALEGMQESLSTLGVRKPGAWQLDEPQSVWRNFRNRKFEPFHRCTGHPARIELSRHVVPNVLGLGEHAVGAVAKLRVLLAADPSIHGSKKAEQPGWSDTMVVLHSSTW